MLHGVFFHKKEEKTVTIQHQDNGQKGEFFQLNAEGERLAEMSYLWRDEHSIVANHTWVDDSLRGQGVARVLLDHLVEFAREKHLKIIPTCSYVDVMFRRDKTLADVQA
ncbi:MULTISPECIES: GNAT family N-acetyltransferase [unclassified Acinetobacter]|uniref:GNAT family N-acetyltransferase n=1 Tax=unclassified Acinetobacter TaxID=196816 RepID=UPI0015D245C5|nr:MULTISPECIES: GNAT family N-acetyltransferase [unclassified Acinetobacter]